MYSKVGFTKEKFIRGNAYLTSFLTNIIVSWIRRRDFHVLTVALHTYTADDRFVAVNMDRSDDWMLQIKLAQLADEGLYECQVNTHPLISFFVNLTVLVPKSSIREAPDLYVKTGSSINLTCIISKSPEPPVFVFWYHNDRMINYDSSGGDISVHKAGQDTAISRLFIKNAQPSDSGNYTCCPSNADASSISVHVLNAVNMLFENVSLFSALEIDFSDGIFNSKF
ncbi:ig-like domain-containing protein [Trichonephila clavata]|uniref:Ig-like domain-containing protein n=1 Tax=Trichonephila clavata TaxID=2740835 RepID=A0A8X6IJ88_TRICU|nr:ig-like domain-containing protein [Trichonephila clavata]